MKRIIPFLFLALLLIGCDSNLKNEDLDKKNILENAIVLNDYNGSGVNFVIKPQNNEEKIDKMGKLILSKAPNLEKDIVNVYELETHYTNNNTIITDITTVKHQDGSWTVRHSDGVYEFAVLEYDANFNLKNIIIPQNNNQMNQIGYMRASTSFKTFYSCVNAEYQRLKQLIESDLANEIVCNLTFPACRTLMVMAGMEKCR